jgi:hypothetical protein
VKKIRKRRDLLERLSKDDPNYAVGKIFHLRAWEQSHGLVADAFGRGVSFPDFVERCAKSVELAAAAHVALKDATPISTRCRELDRLAKRSIELFTRSVASHAKGLGRSKVTAAIRHFSNRVHEIAARSKQQVFQRELALNASEAMDPLTSSVHPITPERTLPDSMTELQLADPPDNPKRTYESSRCWFRGGHIDPAHLDHDFMNASEDAARAMTGNPDAKADDFLELLRTRSINSDRWRMRVEDAHGSAAQYCNDLSRHPDRYPELQNREASGLKEPESSRYWTPALEPAESKFRALLQLDRAAKQVELGRQNDAFAKGLPIEKGKAPFSVEFPDQIPVLKRELLAAGKRLVEQMDSRPEPIRRGRKTKAQTRELRQAWIGRGSPSITASVCDELAKTVCPDEFAEAKRLRRLKRLRDRIRGAILRGPRSPHK